MQRGGYSFTEGSEPTLPDYDAPQQRGTDPVLPVRSPAGYGPMQPGNQADWQQRFGPPVRPPKFQKRKRSHWGRWIGGIFAVLLILLLVLGGIVFQKVYAFGSAISSQSPLSSQLDFSGTNRINLLVMGFGGGNHPGAYLT